MRLTAEGRRIAEELTERYQFFEKLLREAGVDVDEASREACRLEHYVSADSFEKLSSHFRRNRSLGKTVENDETPANPRRYSGGVVAKPIRFREFARMTLPGSPPGATVILEFRFSG